MLVLLSPAKRLDFDAVLPSGVRRTKPRLLEHSESLAAVLGRLDATAIGRLMGISDDLAELNCERFTAWTDAPAAADARPAISAFRGDVYRGLDVDSFDADDLRSAQQRIRILSGLYGLLRPLDAIMPHRLEMGTALKTDRGRTLYDFWGDHVTDLLAADVRRSKSSVVIDLASTEYGRVVRRGDLPVPVVTPVFRERKDGRSRTLALFSKEARGMMARHVALEQIDDLDGLRSFRLGGYRFKPRESDESTFVFERPQPPPRPKGAGARPAAELRA